MNGLSETFSNANLPVKVQACLFHSHFIGADSKLLGSKETLLISCPQYEIDWLKGCAA